MTAYGRDSSGNGLWVAVGNGTANSIATSNNGITWTGLGKTVHPGTSNYGKAIVYGLDSNNNGIWIAGEVITTGTTGNTLAYSSNGSIWVGLGKTIFGNACNDIAYGRDSSNRQLWVAAGIGGNTLAYSYNGISWTGLGLITFTTGGYGVTFGTDISGNYMWVAGGAGSNTLAYSYNGIAWTGLGNTVFSNVCNKISYNMGVSTNLRWVATGDGTVNNYAVSTNGITWTGSGKNASIGIGNYTIVKAVLFESVLYNIPQLPAFTTPTGTDLSFVSVNLTIPATTNVANTVGYYLYFTPSITGSPFTYTSNIASPPKITYGGLISSTAYNVTAIAYGNARIPSIPRTISFYTLGPASAVTGVSASDISFTSVTISFNPSINAELGYNVTFTPPIAGSPFNITTSTNYFTGLTEGTEYSVTILAKGSYGNSEAVTFNKAFRTLGPFVTISAISNWNNSTDVSGTVIYGNAAYRIYAFKSSDTAYSFNYNSPTAKIINILAVGGGGGGGILQGGGGGGGGIIQLVALIEGTGTMTITVGRGGVPEQNGSNTTVSWTGPNGSLTNFTGIGGGGGGASRVFPKSGGSGGGGGSSNGTGTFHVGAAGDASQGKSGGYGYTISGGSPSHGGGGGGAGNAGNNWDTGSSVNGTKYYGSGGNGKKCTLPVIGNSIYKDYYWGGGGGGSSNGNIRTLDGIIIQTSGAGGLGGGGGGGVFSDTVSVPGIISDTASTAISLGSSGKRSPPGVGYGGTNTGGGGGGGSYGSGGVGGSLGRGGSGGSGIVIIAIS